MKSVSAEYYSTFNEMPFLLMTQSYENEDYQLLMKGAILRNEPLLKEEIVKWFGKDYDNVVLED